jgi:hypothetical protein
VGVHGVNLCNYTLPVDIQLLLILMLHLHSKLGWKLEKWSLLDLSTLPNNGSLKRQLEQTDKRQLPARPGERIMFSVSYNNVPFNVINSRTYCGSASACLCSAMLFPIVSMAPEWAGLLASWRKTRRCGKNKENIQWHHPSGIRWIP